MKISSKFEKHRVFLSCEHQTKAYNCQVGTPHLVGIVAMIKAGVGGLSCESLRFTGKEAEFLRRLVLMFFDVHHARPCNAEGVCSGLLGHTKKRRSTLTNLTELWYTEKHELQHLTNEAGVALKEVVFEIVVSCSLVG